MSKRQKRPARAGQAVQNSGQHQEIFLELPTYTFDRIQAVAAKCDVTYEDLIKVWLHEKLKAE